MTTCIRYLHDNFVVESTDSASLIACGVGSIGDFGEFLEKSPAFVMSSSEVTTFSTSTGLKGAF